MHTILTSDHQTLGRFWKTTPSAGTGTKKVHFSTHLFSSNSSARCRRQQRVIEPVWCVLFTYLQFSYLYRRASTTTPLQSRYEQTSLSAACYLSDFSMLHGFYCATQICIARTCYGNVAGGWLSVSRQYCIKTTKPILKPFWPSDRTTILVSSDPCADTQFQGEPLHRGRFIHGVWKIGDFRWKWPISRKRCEIGRWLLWNVNRKSWVPDLVL